ncbi:hypothetical protein Ahia01_001259900 [Argonauta hians]
MGKNSFNVKPVEQDNGTNATLETNSASLVDKITWRHYSFFLIHFLENMAFALSGPVMDQYFYARLAEDHIANTSSSLNSEFDLGENSLCSVNKTSPAYILQQKVQSDAATWGLYFNLIQGIPQAFLVFLLGSWADVLGRKFATAFNMVGSLGRCVINLAVMYWRLPVSYLCIGFFLQGITGGYFAHAIILFVYTADLTSKSRTRGTLLTVVDNVSFLFYGVVNFGTGYFIRELGFFWPTLCAVVLRIVLLIMLLVITKETLKTRGRWSDLSLTKSVQRVLKFYSVSHQHQSKYARLQFYLCIIIFISLSQSINGIWGLELLYQFNSPFCFDSIKRGRYMGITSIVQPLLCMISLKVLQLFFQDCLIGLIGVTTMIGQNIFVALATTEWMLYVAGLVGAPGMLAFAMIRTIVSQLSDAKEQGSVFAGLGTVEAICAMTSSLMLNSIYAHTLLWMKGFVFIVVAICCIVPASLLLALHFVIKKDSKRESVQQVNSVEMEIKDGGPTTSQNNAEDRVKVVQVKIEPKPMPAHSDITKGEHNLGYVNESE